MTTILKTYLLLLMCLLIQFESSAQDIPLTQYFANPVYLNPGFTGSAMKTRFTFGYRDQWRGLQNNQTIIANLDHYSPYYNSGIGLGIYRNSQARNSLKTQIIAPSYSYEIHLSEHFSIRPGVQFAMTNYSIDRSELSFPDQYDNNGPNGLQSNEKISDRVKSFVDINSGFVGYGDNYWFGMSWHHMNRPTIGFNSESRLDPKISLHGGYKIRFDHLSYYLYKPGDHEKSMIFTFNYKNQGPSSLLDLGVYGIYEPIAFGLWYRGIPFKNDYGFARNESLVILFGLHLHEFHIAYSHDISLSGLSRESKGVREITFHYEFQLKKPKIKKKKKYAKRLPCPSF